jgi:hypothetical protein
LLLVDPIVDHAAEAVQVV